MNRYALRTGDHLAISSDAIRHDADGFFLALNGAAPDNEPRGSVTIVHVRGALQQFASPFGDSYEAIESRVGAAFASDPKPSAVVLCISSPGGVVAGLNECVRKLQRMSKESEIPLVAYVGELAASAAYALCCACEERISPPSGVCGSIGVISTMVSVAKNDEKQGIEFKIITSGKRKADGHLHQAISDDAVKAETARNTELADQFFALAGEALGVSPKKLAGLQAGIFLGADAKRVGLVDDVIGLDAAVFGLDTSDGGAPSAAAPNEGNVTDRRASDRAKAGRHDAALDNLSHVVAQHSAEVPMGVRLQAVLKTAAAIAAEKDPAKITALQASLDALVKAGGDDDDDSDDDDKDKDDPDGDDDSKSAKHAARAEKLKMKAKATDLRSKAAGKKSEAAALEEEAKKCEDESSSEEDDEASKGGKDDEASAALALVQSLTGMSGGEALGAMRALAATAVRTAKDVAEIKARGLVDEKAGLIESIAKASTKAEREFLAGEPLATVRGFVKMRLKSGFVNTTEDALIRPKHVEPGSEASLPESTRKMIDEATAVFRGGAKERGAYRELLVKNHIEALNGAGRI